MSRVEASPATIAQHQAADWYVLLSSEEASDELRSQWQHWLQADPEHMAAWTLVQEVVSRFQGLPVELAQVTLDTPKLERRAALKLLGALLAVAGGVAWAPNTGLWQRQFADYRTTTTQRQQWTLADGTQLHLNARSAVDVQFDQRQRLLRLYRGDITIETGHAPGYAQIPFVVETAQGTLRVMGTRFMVSDVDGEVEVSLFEGALQVSPHSAPSRYLQAGQALRLGQGAELSAYPLDPHAAAWEQGLIFADGMPLDHYLRQLSQYRPGILTCDAQAGALRISGVFALDDSDRLLEQLKQILPVRVRYFSRYWVRVEALST